MKGPRLILLVAAFSFLLAGSVGAQQQVPPWPPLQGTTPQWPSPQGQGMTPSYFKADRVLLLNTIGSHSTSYIFSDLLTPQRRSFVAHTLQRLPAPGCPDNPSFTITHVNAVHKDTTTLAWTERFEIGCNPKILRNMLVIAGKERSSNYEMFPGDTIATPQLQKDALIAATVTATSKKPSGCQEQPLLVDTHFIARDSKPPTEWNEVWTFQLCGSKADVDMKFGVAPQGGTAFSASAR